jgi:hypothetical protein
MLFLMLRSAIPLKDQHTLPLVVGMTAHNRQMTSTDDGASDYSDDSYSENSSSSGSSDTVTNEIPFWTPPEHHSKDGRVSRSAGNYVSARPLAAKLF